jgi:tRNA(adenine34) deaminase
MTAPFPLPPAMQHALTLAAQAGREGGVPVGAVVTLDGRVVGEGVNPPPGHHDPSAHAEMIAIRAAAAALGRDRLEGCDLYVTLEPCAMCAGVISHARIARLYYGASDPKGGGVTHGARVFAQATCHHRPEVYDGLGAGEAGALLREFFADRR